MKKDRWCQIKSDYLFLKEIDTAFQKASMIVASGSLPKGLPDTFYKELIELARRYEKPFMLDTSGEPLKKALEAGLVFIKPNLIEFEKLMGAEVKTEHDLVSILEKFPYPIPVIMVSLGEKGAIVKHYGKVYRVSISKVKAVNPVGSGDAVVAGYAAGLYQGLKDEQLFKYSIVMGLLNALESQTGYVNT
ncbi:1-phosphofructokinase family hexose kinase [Metabacillus sp. RGM 3146]|uniref:1-phosphofructokinase family hexose kinase n=1 Tax=Metabacillus sp. RGM 3146 TaxID=3401092 RepID=UPI003B9D2531